MPLAIRDAYVLFASSLFGSFSLLSLPSSICVESYVDRGACMLRHAPDTVVHVFTAKILLSSSFHTSLSSLSSFLTFTLRVPFLFLSAPESIQLKWQGSRGCHPV